MALSPESVWDYPRPPRCEPVEEPIRIVLGGRTIVDGAGAVRVLETTHPPTYYVPLDAVLAGVLRPVEGGSACEWKGRACYWDVVAGDARAPRAAFGYPQPTAAFADLAGRVAFYAGPMDACFVGDERVTPQEGGFYAGWITPNLQGPFKGGPGTWGW